MSKQTVIRVILGLALAVGLSAGARQVFAQDQVPQDPKAAAMARLLESKACQQCDLAGANFTPQMDLKGVDLTGAKLPGASFYRTDVTSANFADADLSKAVFSMANLTNANFSGANLDGANFAGTTGASLAGATTTETTVCPDGQHGPCR